MRRIVLTVFILMALIMFSTARAQERPPSPVVTAKVVSGEIVPQAEYIGTVYFAELSNVASEVSGKVVSVDVVEGQRVKADQVLVQLSSSMLNARIQNAQAILEQATADFELAKIESQRITRLYNAKSVSAGEYDSKRLAAQSAEKVVAAQQATLNELYIERQNKRIKAPFGGVVLEKSIDRGEWVSVGTTVMVVAMDDEFNVVVNAPADAMGVVKEGLKVQVQLAGTELPGTVYAVIPMGDVATRTFPVKIRVKNNGSLAQGMEARVLLPRGAGGTTLVVPRDAVISARGQLVVWAVLDGKAVPMPVKIVGYRNMDAGVVSEKLAPGMDVVVKGNERLQPGQAVAAQPAN